MSGSNSFGKLYTFTSFGESHGAALGVVIDGCPAGVEISADVLQKDLDRRRPGQKDVSGQVLVSARDEADQVEILSGVFEGRTLGTPLMCVVRNRDQRSGDYQKDSSRIGHADDVWKNKFSHSDHRGGGRSSGRETLARVLAGSVARQFLRQRYSDLKVTSFVRAIGDAQLETRELEQLSQGLQNGSLVVDDYSARFPQNRMDVAKLLSDAKDAGESYGGVIETWIDGAPAALGEPIYYKLKNVLASAAMSIGATCGVEFGDGFEMARRKGTEVHTEATSKVYGGLRGGVSTGERIIFRVAFKPTSSITDVAKRGRHDPCIVPRAVPVLEAMSWCVLADMELLRRANRV